MIVRFDKINIEQKWGGNSISVCGCDNCEKEFTIIGKTRQKHHFCCVDCRKKSKQKGGILYCTNMVKCPLILNPSLKEAEKRHKVCSFCKILYCDLLKSGNRSKKTNFCSIECARKYGVKIRHDNGTYIVTEQQKERLFQTLFEKYGKVKRTRKTNIVIPHGMHWSQTDEGRLYLSVRSKGKKVSEQSKMRMRIAQGNRLRTKPESTYTFGCGGFRKDLGCYFRSRWEANFARILNYLGIKWEYEPYTFDLGENLSYTPDFKIENKYTEIKGRPTVKSNRQILLFKEKFPFYELEVVEKKEYEELRRTFKYLIKNWET